MAGTKVRTSTHVGLNRNDMYGLWAGMGLTEGCEVGVHNAVNAIALLNAIPRLRLLCVDPYCVYEYKKQKARTRWKWDQATMDKTRTTAIRRLAKKNVIWMMQPSDIASRAVPDESLDFVYIDGNHHFNFVMKDILCWAPKVRKGGIVAGHDFGIRPVRSALMNYLFYNHIGEVQITDRACDGNRTTVSWMFTKK